MAIKKAFQYSFNILANNIFRQDFSKEFSTIKPNVFQIRNNGSVTLYVGVKDNISSTNFDISILAGTTRVFTYPVSQVHRLSFVASSDSNILVTACYDDDLKAKDLDENQISVVQSITVAPNVGITDGTDSLAVNSGGSINVVVDDTTPPNVAISNTPSVSVSGTPNVSVTNTPSVTIDDTTPPNVAISNTPSVSVSGTPNVSVTNTPSVTIDDTTPPNVAISNTPSVSVSGNVSLDNSSPFDVKDFDTQLMESGNIFSASKQYTSVANNGVSDYQMKTPASGTIKLRRIICCGDGLFSFGLVKDPTITDGTTSPSIFKHKFSGSSNNVNIYHDASGVSGGTYLHRERANINREVELNAELANSADYVVRLQNISGTASDMEVTFEWSEE